MDHNCLTSAYNTASGSPREQVLPDIRTSHPQRQQLVQLSGRIGNWFCTDRAEGQFLRRYSMAGSRKHTEWEKAKATPTPIGGPPLYCSSQVQEDQLAAFHPCPTTACLPAQLPWHQAAQSKLGYGWEVQIPGRQTSQDAAHILRAPLSQAEKMLDGSDLSLGGWPY